MSPKAYNLMEPQAGGELAFIEQVAGREKGRQFELSGSRVSIGRSDDNDIVIQTEAVSRYHAVMERLPDGGWMVRDNQSKNGVLVNGNPIMEYNLRSGDVVQVGTFIFRYNGTSLSSDSPGEVAADEIASASPIPANPAGAAAEFALPGRTARKAPNRRVLLYTAVALVLGGAYYLSQSPSTPDDKKAAEAKTEATVGKTVREDFTPSKEPDLNNMAPKEVNKLPAAEDPILKKAEQDMQKMDWTNSGLRESEAFFRRGQREYLDRNYERAIDDFQTALTIYRGHELAEKYLQRSFFEAEGEAKKNMEIGVKYFESLQYQRAIYHFTQVQALLAHKPDEPLVKEAQKYVEQSKRRLEASELFP